MEKGFVNNKIYIYLQSRFGSNKVGIRTRAPKRVFGEKVEKREKHKDNKQ
jgi:hypothetical protein